jgi:hypothetical protein
MIIPLDIFLQVKGAGTWCHSSNTANFTKEVWIMEKKRRSTWLRLFRSSTYSSNQHAAR